MNQSDQRQDIHVRFLAEGEQSAFDVAQQLAGFIAGARHTLDFALYDFRLSDSVRAIVAGALAERARAGVAIRIVYDADKPLAPRLDVGMDPAPAGTGGFVQSLGYPWVRVDSAKLMHNKYIIRDGGTPEATVWTGSTNFTDDAWTLQENNILTLASPILAAAYSHDFADLWSSGEIDKSGFFDPSFAHLSYEGASAVVRPRFSPGRGPAIDHEIARLVAGAQRRILICSMLLNSGALLSTLGEKLRDGRVAVAGVYDRTQMQTVLEQWRDVPHNRWKIGAIREIVATAGLVGKNSTRYTPTSRHDFMHSKVIVVDDSVITGSYNFSRSAELNAENIVHIECLPLAETYAHCIAHIQQKYASDSVGDIGA